MDMSIIIVLWILKIVFWSMQILFLSFGLWMMVGATKIIIKMKNPRKYRGKIKRDELENDVTKPDNSNNMREETIIHNNGNIGEADGSQNDDCRNLTGLSSDVSVTFNSQNGGTEEVASVVVNKQMRSKIPIRTSNFKELMVQRLRLKEQLAKKLQQSCIPIKASNFADVVLQDIKQKTEQRFKLAKKLQLLKTQIKSFQMKYDQNQDMRILCLVNKLRIEFKNLSELVVQLKL